MLRMKGYLKCLTYSWFTVKQVIHAKLCIILELKGHFCLLCFLVKDILLHFFPYMPAHLRRWDSFLWSRGWYDDGEWVIKRISSIYIYLLNVISIPNSVVHYMPALAITGNRVQRGKGKGKHCKIKTYMQMSQNTYYKYTIGEKACRTPTTADSWRTRQEKEKEQHSGQLYPMTLLEKNQRKAKEDRAAAAAFLTDWLAIALIEGCQIMKMK